MKEIVVISGKGGTGKTSITAALAWVARHEIVAADCDVDAADMHLLLAPDFANATDFVSGELAVINQEACIGCGKCKAVCEFGAVKQLEKTYSVVPLDCEGCGYCARVCPRDAIVMQPQTVGQWYISSTRMELPLVHARLGIGAENSGKLVAQVKKEARRVAESEGKDFVLVDGSPGIGCPVISSLSGADFVTLVTEPTVSGLHDLQRVYELIHQFNIPAGCVINKADLNREKSGEIQQWMAENAIPLLAELPYHPAFTQAITQGYTIAELPDEPFLHPVENLWNQIKKYVEE
jgi:MinD superfamily P-loop ATPase